MKFPSLLVFSAAAFFWALDASGASSAIKPSSVVTPFPLAHADDGYLQANRVITLEEAYDRTLATDQSIRIAYYEIRKANLLPWSALARMGPRLTGNSSYQATRRTTETTSSRSSVDNPDGIISSVTNRTRTDSDNRSLGLTFEQPLIDLTVIPAYQYGKLSAKAARLQYRLTIRDTLFGLAQAYYEVLKQQSIVAVNRQTLDLAGAQLDLATNRFEAGQAARIDVARARSSQEEARNALIQSQGALESSRDTLSNILNLGGRTDFTVAEPPNAPDPQTPIQEAMSRAFNGREDYQISAIGIDQELARRNEIIASYGPRVTAQASTQWTSASGAGSGRTQVNSGVVSVQIPFLTGGQREIDLVSAGHQISQARLYFENTAKSIESDVKNAWIRVGTGREALKALRAAVEASTINYQDVQSQYEAGAAMSLDVQVALRELNNARTQLTNQVYDYQIALRDLQRAEAAFEQSRVQNKAHLR